MIIHSLVCWSITVLSCISTLCVVLQIHRATEKEAVGSIIIIIILYFSEWLGFPGGSVVKNPPAMQETWVLSLGREDPLEKEVATHSNIPSWEIPWMEEPGGLQSMRLQSQTAGVTEGTRHTHSKMSWCWCGVIFFKLVFAGAELLYNAVSISVVPQGESAIHIHTSPLLWISFPLGWPQSVRQSSLCSTAGFRCDLCYT